MSTRVRFQALAILALGAGLGYLIAVTGADRPHVATAEDTVAADLNAALAQRNQQVTARAAAAGRKPNILVIWGDDIGQSNISTYTFDLPPLIEATPGARILGGHNRGRARNATKKSGAGGGHHPQASRG
jgi:hypothetical protein